MRKQIIFGLAGHVACGKGNATKYLEQKYRASTYRFSTILRDMLDRLYLEHTRDNLVKMSEMVRSAYGDDILARAMMKDIEKDKHRIIIIDGVRRKNDLFRLPNFILVAIDADPRVRYERITGRRENVDDATKTFEQFLTDEERSTEKTIDDVIALATEHIDNNGDLHHLYQQLDALTQKYHP